MFSGGPRNALAGNTGTRLKGGRSQQRYEDEAQIARQLLKDKSKDGRVKVSVQTRFFQITKHAKDSLAKSLCTGCALSGVKCGSESP